MSLSSCYFKLLVCLQFWALDFFLRGFILFFMGSAADFRKSFGCSEFMLFGNGVVLEYFSNLKVLLVNLADLVQIFELEMSWKWQFKLVGCWAELWTCLLFCHFLFCSSLLVQALAPSSPFRPKFLHSLQWGWSFKFLPLVLLSISCYGLGVATRQYCHRLVFSAFVLWFCHCLWWKGSFKFSPKEHRPFSPFLSHPCFRIDFPSSNAAARGLSELISDFE